VNRSKLLQVAKGQRKSLEKHNFANRNRLDGNTGSHQREGVELIRFGGQVV
jgi:hypothetical protein